MFWVEIRKEVTIIRCYKESFVLSSNLKSVSNNRIFDKNLYLNYICILVKIGDYFVLLWKLRRETELFRIIIKGYL